MNDKVFIDTNVWVYLHSDSIKVNVAAQLVEKEFAKIIISTQVLTELYNVLVKKNFKTRVEAGNIVDNLTKYFKISNITSDIVKNGIEIANNLQFSIYDSLIIATALQYQCVILYSEDLQHEQIINGKLKIVNPFK